MERSASEGLSRWSVLLSKGEQLISGSWWFYWEGLLIFERKRCVFVFSSTSPFAFKMDFVWLLKEQACCELRGDNRKQVQWKIELFQCKGEMIEMTNVPDATGWMDQYLIRYYYWSKDAGPMRMDRTSRAFMRTTQTDRYSLHPSLYGMYCLDCSTRSARNLNSPLNCTWCLADDVNQTYEARKQRNNNTHADESANSPWYRDHPLT